MNKNKSKSSNGKPVKHQTHREMIQHIKTKEKELRQVAALLKKDFVGIDNIIDNIVESIKIWYIFPELQIRPTIVCLWGLTGVGKTDLIRKLVKYIRMQENFVEIEMGGDDAGKTIQQKLESSSVSSEDKSILFLDEFQKFRTIDTQGGNIKNSCYNDIWTLLSDGKFQNDLRRKTEIVESLLTSKYYRDYNETIQKNKAKKLPSEDDDNEDDDEISAGKSAVRMYNTPVYLARQVKKLFRLPDSIEDIMKWDDNAIYELYNSLANNPDLYESDSYNKMLILLSGNLDEAYSMAIKVGDADVDADFYHERSKKLTIIDIKNALNRRFRPEQIARFGNTHIIYPSLSKANYQEIIRIKCAQINKLIKDTKNIDIQYDDSVYDVIYRNGVFPTQGVRPVLSTVTNILSAAMPKIIFKCLMHKKKTVKIAYANEHLFTVINKQKLSAKIPVVLDTIRKDTNEEMRSLVLVHEVGHAMVYGLLYNMPPKQICLNSVDPFSGGFIMPHKVVCDNKINLMNNVITLLAGRCAEELVFGLDKVSVGAEQDIASATSLCVNYVSEWGLDKYIGRYSNKQEDAFFHERTTVRTEVAESLLNDAKVKANEIINRNAGLLRDLILLGRNKDTMTSEDFTQCFKKHGIILKEGENFSVGYQGILNDFLELPSKPIQAIKVFPEKNNNAKTIEELHG